MEDLFFGSTWHPGRSTKTTASATDPENPAEVSSVSGIFDDAKVTDHYAIIPTDKGLQKARTRRRADLGGLGGSAK